MKVYKIRELMALQHRARLNLFVFIAVVGLLVLVAVFTFRQSDMKSRWESTHDDARQRAIAVPADSTAQFKQQSTDNVRGTAAADPNCRDWAMLSPFQAGEPSERCEKSYLMDTASSEVGDETVVDGVTIDGPIDPQSALVLFDDSDPAAWIADSSRLSSHGIRWMHAYVGCQRGEHEVSTQPACSALRASGPAVLKKLAEMYAQGNVRAGELMLFSFQGWGEHLEPIETVMVDVELMPVPQAIDAIATKLAPLSDLARRFAASPT